MNVSQAYSVDARARRVLWVAIPLLLPFEYLFVSSSYPGALVNAWMLVKGWLAWTLTEYIMHRWSFHAREHTPGYADTLRHVNHHRNPGEIFVTHPVRFLGILVITASVAGIWLAPVWVMYVAGWLSGLAGYTLVHWFLHQAAGAYIMPSLVTQHIWHHCKYTHLCFGVTALFWDHIFGTLPPEYGRLPEKTIRFYYKHTDAPEDKMDELLRRLALTNE